MKDLETLVTNMQKAVEAEEAARLRFVLAEGAGGGVAEEAALEDAIEHRLAAVRAVLAWRPLAPIGVGDMVTWATGRTDRCAPEHVAAWNTWEVRRLVVSVEPARREA